MAKGRGRHRLRGGVSERSTWGRGGEGRKGEKRRRGGGGCTRSPLTYPRADKAFSEPIPPSQLYYHLPIGLVRRSSSARVYFERRSPMRPEDLARARKRNKTKKMCIKKKITHSEVPIQRKRPLKLSLARPFYVRSPACARARRA